MTGRFVVESGLVIVVDKDNVYAMDDHDFDLDGVGFCVESLEGLGLE